MTLISDSITSYRPCQGQVECFPGPYTVLKRRLVGAWRPELVGSGAKTGPSRDVRGAPRRLPAIRSEVSTVGRGRLYTERPLATVRSGPRFLFDIAMGTGYSRA